MRRLPLAVSAVSLLLAPAAFAQERACSCSDLPRLENQLFEQEFLQRESRKYDKTDPLNEGYYDAGSSTNFQNILSRCFDIYISTGNTNCTAPQSNGEHGGSTHDQSTAQNNAPAAGTDVFSASCGLIDVAHGGKPMTASDYRNRKDQGSDCKIDNDFVLAHEAQHQKVCRKEWAAGHGKDYQNPSFFAADDAKAYGAGIKMLRKEIAQLSKDCGWEGSTNENRPDKNSKQDPKHPPPDLPTVPTPDIAKQLANNLMKGRGK